MGVPWGVDPSVTITVEVAFASDPYATTPTFTDVSAYVRGFETSRGSGSETLFFAPGSMRVVFGNEDRRFDPDYSAGPYFGTLKPMKRVRVTATRSAASFVVFLGWVTGWSQDWRIGDGVAYADCVDGGYFVANVPLAGSAYEGEVLADAPTHYWTMQGESIGRDYGSGDVDLNVRPSSQGGSVLHPAGTSDAVAQVDKLTPIGGSTFATEMYAATDSPTSITSAPKALEFWHDFTTGQSLPAFALGSSTTDYISIESPQIGYSNTADNRNGLITLSADDLPTGIHHYAVYVDASNLYFAIDGQVRRSSALSVGTTSFTSVALSYVRTWGNLGSGGVAHVALYSTAPAISRILSHYLAGAYAYGHPYNECGGTRIGRCLDEIGYPSNLRDISDGGTVQGPYLPGGRQVMDYIDEVNQSEQGIVCYSVDGKLTFRDREWMWISADADGVVFSDDKAPGSVAYAEGSPSSGTVETVRNIVTVSYSDVGAITNRDATSQTAYGPSREFIDAPTIRNGTDASNLGKYVLRNKKDPKSVIPELVVKMRQNIATNFPAVLALDIGDVVTVERTPMGVGSQIVRRHQVSGISHSFSRQAWEVRFYLSPATPMADEVPYFTIAHATYGRVGAPAGNAIPG